MAVAEVREQLADARACELWCRLFGSEVANRPPDSRPLAGARRQPLERAGITSQVEAKRVLEVLRADIDWLSEAATPEQQAALAEPGAVPDLRKTATWGDTDEGKAARQAETQRLHEDYERHWAERAPW